MCQLIVCQPKKIPHCVPSYLGPRYKSAQCQPLPPSWPTTWFNVKDTIMMQTFEILDHHENRSRSSSWFYHHLRDSARSRRWSQFSEFPRSIWKWTDEFGKLIPKTRSYKIVTNAKLFENIHLLLKSTKIRLTPTIQFDHEFFLYSISFLGMSLDLQNDAALCSCPFLASLHASVFTFIDSVQIILVT